MDLFVIYPHLAAVLALLFTAAYWYRRARAPWGRRGGRLAIAAASIAWWAYLGWEYYVQAVEGADIRVDLLFLYPVLALISAIGVVGYLVSGRRKPGQGS